jgi:thioredoxin reductase
VPATPAADVDAVVVGGGPAGLSAATWLGRHRRRTVVLDRVEQRNRAVDVSHGYLGFDAMPPSALLARARTDLLRYETVELWPHGVAAIDDLGTDGEAGPFRVTTDETTLTARRLVLATGITDEMPPVEGLVEHYGADVAVCPACDGFEARDQPAVVIGWSEHVAGFALTLLDWVSELTVLTYGTRYEGDERDLAVLEHHGASVVGTPPTRLIGSRGDLQGVVLADGRRLRCRKGFVNIGHHPSTALAGRLGCTLDGEGYVVVDEQGATTVAGVFAAGDCTPGPQLVQVAAASGAVAGIACAISLRGAPAVRGAPRPGPDPEDELAAGGP